MSTPGHEGIAWVGLSADPELPASVICAARVHAPVSHQMSLMKHRLLLFF